MSAAAKRKIAGLAITILIYALMIVFGELGRPYSEIADLTVVVLYLGWLALESITVVQDWVFGRSNEETLVRRWLRWVTDDYPPRKATS